MTTSTNPFFTPEFVAEFKTPSLTPPTNSIFNTGKFLLPCAGSQLINALFSHFQERSLHLSHTLLLQASTTRIFGERTVAYFPEPVSTPEMLTPFQRTQTLHYLSAVMSKLDVTIGPMHQRATGITTIQPTRLFNDFLPGAGSTIIVSPLKIHQLTTAFAQDHQMAQQILIFEIAVILFHEFAHVLVCAILPIGWGGNCFLGNGPTDEIGFEFESRTFGGLIQRDPGAIFGPQWNQCFDQMLVQREWPYPHTMDIYRDTPNFLTPLMQDGGEISRVCRLWKMPFAYINDMFLDEFWALVPLRGEDGLRMRREKGCLTIALDPEDYGGDLFSILFEQQEDLVAADYLPVGFVLESSGLVRRAAA